MWQPLNTVIIASLLVVVLLVAAACALQHKMIFFPDRTITRTPDQLGLIYEDVYYETADGVLINGWFIPVEGAERTLLFLHGNAGNLSNRLEILKLFHELGLSIFIIDYRGYGRSQGTPDEAGTYSDALGAWRYLTEVRGLSDRSIIVLGRSLGGAVATWLASRHTPAALILESTFTSIADMSKYYSFALPLTPLIRIHYASIDRIGDIQCPVLIAHSPADTIVPFELGRALFAAARQPKRFLELRGGHNDGFVTTGDAYRLGMRTFIDTHVGGR